MLKFQDPLTGQCLKIFKIKLIKKYNVINEMFKSQEPFTDHCSNFCPYFSQASRSDQYKWRFKIHQTQLYVVLYNHGILSHVFVSFFPLVYIVCLLYMLCYLSMYAPSWINNNNCRQAVSPKSPGSDQYKWGVSESELGAITVWWRHAYQSLCHWEEGRSQGQLDWYCHGGARYASKSVFLQNCCSYFSYTCQSCSQNRNTIQILISNAAK